MSSRGYNLDLARNVDGSPVGEPAWRIFDWERRLVTVGPAREFTRAEHGVLRSLIANLDLATFEAYPAVATMSRQAGVSRRVVQLALRSLQHGHRLIEQLPDGYGGRSTPTYRLVWSGWESPAAEPDPAGRESPAGQEAGPAGNPRAGQPTDEREGGALWRAPGGAVARAPGRCGARQGARATAPIPIGEEKSREESVVGATPARPPCDAEAGLFDDDDAVKLLIATGAWKADRVGRRDAKGLVRAHGARAVQDGVRHAQLKRDAGEIHSNFRGYIVRAVQGYADGTWQPDPRLEQQAERARAHEAARQRREADAEARRAEERRIEAEQQETARVWAQLSPAQREDLHRQVLADMDPQTRRFSEGTPLDSRGMRALIVRRYLEQQR